jgi:hypothetical protein
MTSRASRADRTGAARTRPRAQRVLGEVVRDRCHDVDVPCRPSFEELEWGRLSHSERECEDLLDRRWCELTDTNLMIIVDLLVDAGTPVYERQALDRARHEARELVKRGRIPPAAPWPVAGHLQLANLDSRVAFLCDLAGRLELTLCILETQLARWHRDGVLRKYGLDQEPDVRSLLSSHLAHRRDDKRAALEAAANDPDRTARIHASDDSVLCCDRDCLC